MLRYPYNIYLKTADGWVAGAALLYGAFATFSGLAVGRAGGRYAVVSGSDARVIGFLFMSAAIGYFAWTDWRATTSWKAKMMMWGSLLAFCAVLALFIWRAFAS